MGLRSIAVRAWTLSVAKFQPVTLTPLWEDQALAATGRRSPSRGLMRCSRPGENHQPVDHRRNRDHGTEGGQRPAAAVLDRRMVRQQELSAGAADMGIKHRGHQGQDVATTASAFGFVFIDVPVEIVVGVAPPFDVVRIRDEGLQDRVEKRSQIRLKVLNRGGSMNGSVSLWRLG